MDCKKELQNRIEIAKIKKKQGGIPMKKRIIALFLLAALALTLFAACSKEEKVLTKDEAIEIALKDAGITDTGKYHIHADPSPATGTPKSYTIHIHGPQEFSYVVDAKTGEFVKN